MSSDLKIEIFAYHIFCKAWSAVLKKEIEPKILQIYGDECIKDNSYAEAYDDSFHAAFNIRLFLFCTLYKEEMDLERAKTWTLSDCYDYVTSKCNRDDLFGHLNIFDRMFATCSYVWSLCICIRENSLIDVVNYGHIIWAMYFDQFSEKFYREGGWNELKRVASPYKPIYEFSNNFLKADRWSIKEASVNYHQFQMAVKYDSCKYKQKCSIHISKLWVRFHIEHFEEYIRIPSMNDDLANWFEIELLLQDLKLLCNCSWEYDFNKDKILQDKFKGTFHFTGTSYSKTFDDKSEEIKTIDNECRKSSRKDFETPLQSVYSTPSEKVMVYERADKNKNCGNVKNGSFELGIPGNKSGAVLDEYSGIGYDNLNDKTICPVIETNTKNSTNITNFDLNDKFTSFASKNKKEDAPHEITVKRQSDVMNAPEILSARKNQNKESKLPRKISTENLLNPTDLCSNNQVIESHDSIESPRSPLDSKLSNKNVDLCNENTEITDVSSTNQTATNYYEKNAILNNPCTLEDSLAGIEVSNNSDGKINTNKNLDKPRKEQNDPQIGKFLRMILVLGDRQGIQNVCGTLCSREDGRENSQVRSNKGKKKSKKKSRK